MFEAAVTSMNATVLVLEDDPYVLNFMESSLRLCGYEVIPATSTKDAWKQFEKKGSENIDAIISDFRLPDGTGLEFLKRVLNEDPTLATVVVTGQGEKAVVQESMAMGVYQYLEKPVTHQDLRKLIKDTVAETTRSRQSRRDRQGLEELEAFDQRTSGKVPERLSRHIDIYYQPLHEVGGDFFMTHTYSENEWVILVGDVSGHDIKSGYVSTYFRGMFRGCVENGSRVQEFLQLFNRTLENQSKLSADELVSISLTALYVNFSNDWVCHWNYGAPPGYAVSPEGFIKPCPYGRPPLGWLDSLPTEASHIPVARTQFIYLYTDGLMECASELDINFFSLLYRLFTARNTISDLRNSSKDDILAIRYNVNPQSIVNTVFEPLLSEHYAGSEVEQIDYLQANWRRSLNFALGDRLGDRLYDLLICIREGMLNALIHGCERSADKFAHLQISLREDKELIRVVIDDPGRGHNFNLKERLERLETESGKHLGLGIIQHLSDDFQIENKGTSLIFDFEVHPVEAS